MRPLAIGLDKLQSNNACGLGQILPLITGIRKAIKKELLPNSRIFYCKPLAQAILDGLEKRFGHLFYNKHHILASITHPEYKTRFFEDPVQKEEAIQMLKAEYLKKKPNSVTNQSLNQNKSNSKNDSLLFYADESDHENDIDEVTKFLKSKRRDLEELKEYPIIEEIFREKNTILASSAFVERMFSLGALILTQKRQRLGNKSFEKQLMLKSNRKFYKEFDISKFI